MERKIDLLEVIMQLVTVQGLSSRYEALKQNLFVRGDDIPYAELCETIKLNCQRIDITAGLVPGISPLYALRPSGGKPECPFCKGKGTVKYHELKDCWAKYPHLRPPSRTPVVAAPSGDRAKDPNSKRSLKAARKAAAANEKASKQMHSDEERNSWHTHAEHDKPDDSDLHALRKQSPPTQTIEFEVDSGSECNYMPTSEHLENYRTANHGGHTIVCATGSRNPTEGAGSIGEVLPKVFVNSKIVNPIMAVIAQYNAGRATLFHPKYGVVIAAADDMVVSYTNPIATGGVRNGAFKVDIPITPRMPQANKIQFVKATARERLEGKCNLQLGRFGFAGPARIAALAKDPAYKLDLPAKVPIDAFKIQENDVYQLAKSREKPHRNLGMKITAKKPFELVHIDCITEPVAGYGGVKYTLVATCDYSAWTYAVNLVSRADVPKALQTWIRTFVEPLHFKVDRIRMDNAGEQISMTMTELLVAGSIAPQYSSANSSASNGVAERSNQTLETLSRAMLLNARLPQKAWPLANETAAFLKCRLPTRRNPNSMTPYERVYGVKPDLSILRTFGCKAYVHTFKPTGLKLDARAKIGTMVGYDAHSKRYRILMDPERGTAVLSANVTFAETVMNLAGSVRSLPGFSAKHIFDSDDEDDTAVPAGSGGAGTAPLVTPAPAMQAAPVTTAPNAPAVLPVAVVPAAVPVVPAVVPAVPAVPAATALPPFITPPLNRYPMEADTVRLPEQDDYGFGHDHAGGHNSDDSVIVQDTEAADIEELLIPALRERPQRTAKAPDKLGYTDSHVRHRGKYAKSMKACICNVHAARISFGEAMTDPLLRAAARKELHDILTPPQNHALNPTNGVLKAAVEVVKIPPGVNLIDSTWVFKKKYNQDGEYERAKARVAPRGFKQKAGQDYNADDVEAPTLSIESAMFFLGLQVQRNMSVRLIDFDSAFQHTAVDLPIYMRTPQGMVSRPGECLKLNNALQGTKQAACLFNNKTTRQLKAMGFKQSAYDPCVFVLWVGDTLTAVAVYVDDLRCMAEGPNAEATLDALYTELSKIGPCKIADANNWLGMKIEHDRVAGTLKVSQEKYINEMLQNFGMADCKPCRTPAAPGTKLVKTPDGEHDAQSAAFPYRSLVGALLWPARTARPEIIYAVNQCGAHSNNPGPTHIAAAKRVLRYLKGTAEMGITFRRNPTGEFQLRAFADADYAGEPEENDHPMRSLSGMIAYVHGVGPIYCKSQLQSTVARSTAESEYKSASIAAQVVCGFRNFLASFGFEQIEPTPIGGDNQAALAQLKSRLSGSKSRHVKVDFHYVKELVQQKEVTFYYSPTAEMVADIMTKALPIVQFQYLRDVLLNKM